MTVQAKGHVRHEQQGNRFVYLPVASRSAVRKSALRHLIDTFYDGSAGRLVESLLGGNVSRLSAGELDRIAELIEEARREGIR